MPQKNQEKPVALITGGARRIGACISETLQSSGFNVIIHYRHSEKEALMLKNKLNALRPHSVEIIPADLDNPALYTSLIARAQNQWGRLDVLINNASTFLSSPIEKADLTTWDLLLNSNLKAPFFLTQAARIYLKKTKGCVINITDVHANNPLKNYPIYSCAKAGLAMLTRALALELAPEIRVNAIAPGSVLWPEGENSYSEKQKKAILSATLLKKQIAPEEIASAALFLIQHSSITGQVIIIDGGKSVAC